MEDVGVSNSELQAESHHADQLAEENAALKSQLEELQQRMSGGEEVDSPTSLKQQVEQVTVCVWRGVVSHTCTCTFMYTEYVVIQQLNSCD